MITWIEIGGTLGMIGSMCIYLWFVQVDMRQERDRALVYVFGSISLLAVISLLLPILFGGRVYRWDGLLWCVALLTVLMAGAIRLWFYRHDAQWRRG
jgi:hypothetical protein